MSTKLNIQFFLPIVFMIKIMVTRMFTANPPAGILLRLVAGLSKSQKRKPSTVSDATLKS